MSSDVVITFIDQVRILKGQGLMFKDAAVKFKIGVRQFDRRIRKASDGKTWSKLTPITIDENAPGSVVKTALNVRTQKQLTHKGPRKQSSHLPPTPPPLTPEDKSEMDLLVSQAPKNVQPLVKKMGAEFYKDANVKTFNAIMSYLEKVDQLKVEQNMLTDGQVGSNKAFYERAPKLTKKQNLIIDALRSKKVVFVEGARRSGKSVSIWTFICEFLAEEKRTALFLASGGKLAEQLHNQFWFNTKVDQGVMRKWIMQGRGYHSSRKTTFPNGSEFLVRNTKNTDITGLSGSIIWIDEFDKVLVNNPQAIADAVAIALDRDDIKLIFSANRPKGEDLGAFNMFRDLFNSEAFWDKKNLSREALDVLFNSVGYFTLEAIDAPFSYKAEVDDIDGHVRFVLVEAIQEITMGEEYTKSQLGNEDPSTGVVFSDGYLSNAMVLYDQVLAQMINSTRNARIMGLDPSDGGHPFGMGVFDVYIGERGHDADSATHKIIENMSKQYSGEQNKDDDFIFNDLLQLGVEKRISHLVCESNSGGMKLSLKLKKHWKDRFGLKVDVIMQNYGKEEDGRGHQAFINNMRKYLIRTQFFFKNLQIKSQLARYNPNISKGTARKGDIADMTIHVVWLADLLILKGARGRRKGLRTFGG